MLSEVLLLIAHVVSMISGSIVLDSTGQRNVYLTDYCPKMKFCAEGAHVMCMYYNSKNPMGPSCSNAQNISMSPELANKLLDVSNAVRSRIAQGKEKGKHGNILPRGYGIFRLNWDTELATFAQVLANQCVLRHDLCRATKRFPDPGQTAGLVRFTYPDWFPVSKSGNFSTPGLDSAKLLYATTQILKSWYGQKNSVTPNMITIYPDWASSPHSQEGRLYLEMIYGSATHMGCGISAYTEYAFYDSNAALNYNSIQIICNYSARPRKGSAVYNTVPPGDTEEPISRCGCPFGSEGDEECLCQPVQRKPIPITGLKEEIRQCPVGQVCDPTVVVLPIFTVEDAPPEKLLNHASFANASLRRPVHNSIFQNGYDSYQYKRNGNTDKRNNPGAYGSKDKSSPKQTYNIRPTTHHHTVAIRNRYFDKKHMEKQEHQSQAARNGKKKTSLFSRPAKFELPGPYSIRPTKHTGLKDVVPRKDFTEAKQLVNKYLYGKNDLLKPGYNKPMIEESSVDKHEVLNHFNEHVQMTREINEHLINQQENNIMANSLIKATQNEKNMYNKQQQLHIATQNVAPMFEHHKMKNVIANEHHLNEVFNILNATKPKVMNEIALYQNIQRSTTETTLNKAEQNVMRQDELFKQIVSNTNDFKPLNSVTEETDNKLMALLDTLEQEIKHVELRDKDKQLFDARIRKIYGKVVGKPADMYLSASKYIKPKEVLPDLTKTYVMKKSVQQEPKEDKKYTAREALEEPERRSEMYFKKYANSTRDRDEINKYNEQNMFIKRDGLRGMKHRDISNEPIRYHDYETDQGYGERKTYRNNDFDRNTLTDLDGPRHRGTDVKYRSRNTEINRHYRYGELDHRNGNELEHRNMNENYRINNDLERSLRKKNYYLNNDAANNDPLSIERRRFYQEKLENIEQKLHMRNNKKRKEKTRHRRPVRPTARKSESQMNIYGRGRFAHGY